MAKKNRTPPVPFETARAALCDAASPLLVKLSRLITSAGEGVDGWTLANADEVQNTLMDALNQLVNGDYERAPSLADDPSRAARTGEPLAELRERIRRCYLGIEQWVRGIATGDSECWEAAIEAASPEFDDDRADASLVGWMIARAIRLAQTDPALAEWGAPAWELARMSGADRGLDSGLYSRGEFAAESAKAARRLKPKARKMAAIVKQALAVGAAPPGSD